MSTANVQNLPYFYFRSAVGRLMRIHSTWFSTKKKM